MTEYITKDRAMDLIIAASYDHPDRQARLMSMLEDEPAADVVPVTYCKYCMHCQPRTEISLFQYAEGENMGDLGIYQHKTEIVCNLYGVKVSPYFYCKSGKRWG